MLKKTHRNFLSFDLVQEGLPEGIESRGFFPSEAGDGVRWCWTEGGYASLSGNDMPVHGFRLRFRAKIPKKGTQLELHWNGSLLSKCSAKTDEEELDWSFQLPGSPKWQLALVCSDWSGKKTQFAGSDKRELGVLIKELRLGPPDTEGRICPYPFARMEMPGNPFVPCCQSWLRQEYFQLEQGDDAWNGPAARALRESVLDGSYRYCHLDRCGSVLVPRDELKESKDSDLAISAANLKAIQKHETRMPDGPQAATLMGDPRCNLACPSCRPEKVTKLDAIAEKNFSAMESELSRHENSLRRIKVAGDGEALFSPGLKAILANSSRFPALKRIDLLTNGLLLDSATLAELDKDEKIRSVSVSIDAGDAATYKTVRGGDWERLLRNLEWAASERQRGRFDFLGLNFVLRKTNLDSLTAFFSLAERLSADEVYVSPLLPWGRMPVSLMEESVHEPAHPDYARFAETWRSLQSKTWKFRIRSTLA